MGPMVKILSENWNGLSEEEKKVPEGSSVPCLWEGTSSRSPTYGCFLSAAVPCTCCRGQRALSEGTRGGPNHLHIL
jgi:hypothetical protein